MRVPCVVVVDFVLVQSAEPCIDVSP